MKSKNAQLTIFIIVGILFLTAIVLMIFVFSGSGKTDLQVSSDKVNTFVVDCFESTIQNGIFFVGLQGGYNEVDNPKLEDPSFNVPLYFVDGGFIRFPSLENVESELSDYVETRIIDCVDNLEVEYDEEDINADLSIRDKKVVANLDFPIRVSYSGSSTVLDEFYVEVDSDLKKRFGAVEEYVEEQKLKPDYLRIESLDRIANESDLNVETYVYTDDNVVFKFVGDEVHPLFSNYTFVFAIKYDWGGV